MIQKLSAAFMLAIVPSGIVLAEDSWRLSPAVRKQCLEVLRSGLQSDEFWPSIHAAEALTLAGKQKEVRTHLEPLLKRESDDQRRCGIARELVRAGDKKRSRMMLDILGQKDSNGRVHAAESLYKVGWVGDETPLQQAFAETGDQRLRLMAAAAIAKHGSSADRQAVFTLLRHTLMKSDDPAIFRLVAWILGRIGDSTDRELIRSRLVDADDSLAKAFLEHALAALGDKSGRQALLSNLKSQEPALRVYAAVFAGESGIVEAAPLLTKQLKDDNLDARIRAAQALLTLAANQAKRP